MRRHKYRLKLNTNNAHQDTQYLKASSSVSNQNLNFRNRRPRWDSPWTGKNGSSTTALAGTRALRPGQARAPTAPLSSCSATIASRAQVQDRQGPALMA